MKTHSLSSLILGMMSLFCTCNAHEEISHYFSEKDHNCFIAQTEDKIYINPEAIIIYENKIYLNINNNPSPVVRWTRAQMQRLFDDAKNQLLSSFRYKVLPSDSYPS
jgi:hypothetical protein